MANPEHLEILQQGVEEWNKFRREHPAARPDLTEAYLYGAKLSGADLSGAGLRGANLCAYLSRADLSRSDLSGADLSAADLYKADLNAAILREANLRRAILREANLRESNLRGVTLSGANLYRADLSAADLSKADLVGANLFGAKFDGADLSRANFTGARAGGTNFAYVDLSTSGGLETIVHMAPSTIGIDTIYLSRGKIPEGFLRGCGVPARFVTYMGLLVESPKYYTCFISYSSQDQEFAERPHADLQAKGVPCWFAAEDLKIGQKFQEKIEDSIRRHDKLLLVLSEKSIQSPWVEREVQAAFEREHKSKKLVLFPIRLDETVMETTKAWAADIRRTRHIGEFGQWREHNSYKKALERLLRDLKAGEGEAVDSG